MPSQKRITIAGDELRLLLEALNKYRLLSAYDVWRSADAKNYEILKYALPSLNKLIAKLEKCEKLEGVTEA